VKLIERDEARRLRREEGLAIRVIAEQLGVSKSSVSVWTRDIELTEEQHEQLRQAEHGRAQAGQRDLLHLQAACCSGRRAHGAATAWSSPTPTSRCTACSCASSGGQASVTSRSR
jgi:predicted transcriptional regulator